MSIPSAIIAKTQAVTPTLPDRILFGAAYYDEYAPADRLEQDVAMMKAAHITVVRIAESTWGTMETAPGVFDFHHIDRVLAAMHKAGIKVIIGTPTYAIPTWLANQHPDVLAITPQGPYTYGRRQNMDITNPAFRQAAERAIVALVSHVKDHPAVIGYQLDNETKAYGTSGPNVQAAFVAHMQRRFKGDLNALNAAFGLNYWSNRINRWEDFPSTNGSINASLSGAFAAFQRDLVSQYLAWQADLVRAHARKDQFLTQNFDFEWRGYSYGVQPDVNHWQAARALDVAGVDIYHPGQDKLTGAEIAMGGDLARSIKGGQNYLVMETTAQGFPEWTPYPGQLRLQAYAHLASGANMVAYWHWGTTAHAAETYWRGLLSQDFQPNATYREAATIGADLARLGPKLANMTKANKVAIYVSNTALTAFDSFKPQAEGRAIGYNDVMRAYYDALYRQNVEVDFITPDNAADLSRYKLVVVPALYAASNADIDRLNDYAKAGGHVLYTFKSGFADENTAVRYADQPGRIAAAAGIRYQQFAAPVGVTLDGDPFKVGEKANAVRWWMEFVEPTTAQVVARYKHPSWPSYAAITRNGWGRGQVTYVGFMPSDEVLGALLQEEVRQAGAESGETVRYPLIVRKGRLTNGHNVRYVLNYSANSAIYDAPAAGQDLLTQQKVGAGQKLALTAWGVRILEEDGH
ncbi:beta-galactosidase [Novosphingobium ovatum]|uniref:beta-galactosidase n=1 Tax=Novosphingobium ovatum TaxID=1908523 RepID=UPI001D0F5D42|nr:beta-galactosidase [Novosphingobium ovatum]